MTDFLALIAYLCAQARKEAEAHNYGWSKSCISLAKEAAEAYAILLRVTEGTE